jgi:hypothetical protein
MRLKVPALDPHTGRLDGLHLWHLLDDTAALYRLLSLGISTWGQLRALHDHGGTRLLDGLDRHVARAGRVARLIEAAFTAWRIGRGRPVDRTVLQDSGVVSDRFMDRVAELCAAVNGDARALLAGLKDGAVKRWQESSSEGLETYLRDGGYLVDQTPLSPGDLRAMVLASVAEAVSAGAIPVTRVERVLAELQGLP